MSIINAIKNRQAAKSLIDIDIPESSWKPDFDLIDRYQSFANELMRISLLGIAGYGFLISEVCMKEAKFYHLVTSSKTILSVGAGFLGASLVFVLIYRFISSACLFYQILILRSLKRLENAHWTVEDKTKELIFLGDTRKTQRNKSLTSRKILGSAAVCFAIGFIFVIVFFWEFLSQFAAINK